MGREGLLVVTLIGSADLARAVEYGSNGCRVLSCWTLAHFEAMARSGEADLLVYEAGVDGRVADSSVPRLLAAAMCPVLVTLKGIGGPPREVLEIIKSGNLKHIEYSVGLPAETESAVRRLVARQRQQSALQPILSALLRGVPDELVDLMVYVVVLAHGDVTVPLLGAASGVSVRTVEARFHAYGAMASYCLHAAHVAVALYRYLELGWKTPDVVVAGCFPDAAAVSHRIKAYSGKPLKAWRKGGGFLAALEAVVDQLTSRTRSGAHDAANRS